MTYSPRPIQRQKRPKFQSLVGRRTFSARAVKRYADQVINLQAGLTASFRESVKASHGTSHKPAAASDRKGPAA